MWAVNDNHMDILLSHHFRTAARFLNAELITVAQLLKNTTYVKHECSRDKCEHWSYSVII